MKRFIAFARIFTGDIRGFREGFAYLFRGAHRLFRDRTLYPYLVAPVLLNILLFLAFLWVAAQVFVAVFGRGVPESWWGIALFVGVIIASLITLLFVGSALFVFLGSIICAPFYEAIAVRIAREQGRIVVDRPWWSQMGSIMARSAKKWWWYLLIQLGLLVLFFMPIAVGPVAYSVCGFLVTTFFLAWEYLDMSFDFRGLSFEQRWKWCLLHRGILFGFGTAIFLGFAIPILNLFIPACAVVGSILLFEHKDNPR